MYGVFEGGVALVGVDFFFFQAVFAFAQGVVADVEHCGQGMVIEPDFYKAAQVHVVCGKRGEQAAQLVGEIVIAVVDCID